MTSGKRAKAQRRQATMIQSSTPRDPAAPPPSYRDHALGEHAGAYVQWQERMKAGLLSIMEENRKALDACTGDAGCPSSVHYPSCTVAQ